MKKRICILIIAALMGLLCSCGAAEATCDVVATTLPVYEFTSRICQGTDITVGQLVTESVSCLHDYSLQVSHMRLVEGAQAVVISGGGLEDFLQDALTSAHTVVDASQGIELICPEEEHDHDHDHTHDHLDDHGHSHENDPHFWLSPACAMTMSENICAGLTALYPEHSEVFEENLQALLAELAQLQAYGQEHLSQLSGRELITFHDGFAYLAQSYGLTILQAIEEESGREASAGELKEMILLVQEHQLSAVFTERNGSVSAADIIAAETGCGVYSLDMAMSGDSYFTAMYHNIDTIKEALG